MDLAQLKTLLSVAQHGSLAAAARALDVDPSAVSRTVAAAEAHLQIRVFERSTRRLAVTAAGQDYLDRIAPLLEELEQAADAARAARRAPSGRLRLTASVAFGQECLVPLLPAFRRTLPDIELDLVLSDANLDLVAERIDLAVRLAPAPKGQLISTRLMQTRYHLCAAPSYAEAHVENRDGLAHPADLAGHECLRMPLPGFQDHWRFRNSTGQEATVPVKGPLTISSPLALRAAARLGLGPALLADWLAAGDLASGRLVDLLPDWQPAAGSFSTGAWALYPSRAYVPARLRATLDFLKSRLK